MIDVHSHIIPGVDDGSKSVEDTYNMILEAKNAGFTDIFATSHYMTHYYEPKGEELILWTKKIQELLIAKDININIHSGMEVYVSNSLDELIKNKKILKLENSKYLLMELPINSPINNLDHILFILEALSIKLILAHPERYVYVQDNPKLIDEYIEKGILLQCNYGSIIGQYGLKSKQIMKKMLKKGQVHFLGSDCHRPNGIYKNIPQAVDKIKSIIGEEEFDKISTKNPMKILENREWIY